MFSFSLTEQVMYPFNVPSYISSVGWKMLYIIIKKSKHENFERKKKLFWMRSSFE